MARDVINLLIAKASLPPREFKDDMVPTSTSNPVARLQAAATYVNLTEVFVDDFIGATNNTTISHLTHSRAMLHRIHSVFPPSNVTGH